MTNNSAMNFLMNILASGKNPEALVKNMISQNPQFNAVYNQAQQSGMSMKDFTMQYARQNNIDIQPLINMVSQKGIK